MSDSSGTPDNVIDDLRKAAGVRPESRPVAGAVDLRPLDPVEAERLAIEEWAARQREWEEHGGFLAKGGSDPGGREGFARRMRRLGR